MSVLGKAIRNKCMDCTCQQQDEVRNCTVERCPLYLFRMGKNPFSNRKGNPEALRKAKEATTPQQ